MRSMERRQFNLRFIFWVTTGTAIICAILSFGFQRATAAARSEELRREEVRRQRERALAKWLHRPNPSSWDFGP
ncbi:MAG TPA: hypothetical protein VHC22_14875 [Pirellulales bacterium]|nr:hypothetical protein [Pirellulales bacterium]